MKKLMAFSHCLVVAAVVGLALPAQAEASPITITFDVRNASNVSLADGSFSYDSSLAGTVLSYANLQTFLFHFPGTGVSYNLAFVNSGGFQSPYWNFEFNTATNTFNFATGHPAGSPLAAIKAGYVDGFWVGNNTAVGDYSKGYPDGLGLWSSVLITETTSAVPEPATLLLLGTGLAALVARRRHGARSR